MKQQNHVITLKCVVNCYTNLYVVVPVGVCGLVDRALGLTLYGVFEDDVMASDITDW